MIHALRSQVSMTVGVSRFVRRMSLTKCHQICAKNYQYHRYRLTFIQVTGDNPDERYNTYRDFLLLPYYSGCGRATPRDPPPPSLMGGIPPSSAHRPHSGVQVLQEKPCVSYITLASALSPHNSHPNGIQSFLCIRRSRTEPTLTFGRTQILNRTPSSQGSFISLR